MKTILLVCGSGIATSTAILYEIQNKLEERGIEANYKQCDVFTVESNLADVSLIAYTCTLQQDFGVPMVNAIPLLTGINAESTIDQIVKILSK